MAPGVTIVLANGETLNFDAALTMAHDRTADVTENPVEKGAKISDHIRPHPMHFKVAGIIVAAPIVRPSPFFYDVPEVDPSRTKKAYTALQAAWKAADVVEVQTDLEVYKNLAIKSLNFPQDANTGKDLYFTIDFKEVIYVSSQTVKVPPKAVVPAARPGASAKTNKGQKPTATVPAKAPQVPAIDKGLGRVVPKSALNRVLGAFGIYH